MSTAACAGLTAVSLFAGIGGFDLALTRAGVRVVAAVEIDPDARNILRRHFPDVSLFDDVCEVTGDQLRAAAHGQPGTIGTAVRRLTPVECERLQGFPDGWTSGQSDAARYRQLGNAVAVPCVEWIARRLVAVEMKRFVNPRPTRRDERRICDRNKRPRLGPGAPTPEAGSLPTNVVRESLRDSVPMSITLPCRISLPQAGDLG